MRRGGRQSFINRFMGDEESDDSPHNQQLSRTQNPDLTQDLVTSGAVYNGNQSFNGQNPFDLYNGQANQDAHNSQLNGVEEQSMATSNNLTNIFVGDNRVGGGRSSSIGGASNNASILLQQQNNNFLLSHLQSQLNAESRLNHRSYGLVDSSDFDADRENEDEDDNEEDDEEYNEDVYGSEDLSNERSNYSRTTRQAEVSRLADVQRLVDLYMARNQTSQQHLAYNLATHLSSVNRNTSDTRFGNIDPSALRDTFDLIDRQRSAAAVLDQANENNSFSSSALSHTNRAYEPIHATGLFDYQRHMSEAYDVDSQDDEDDEDDDRGHNQELSYQTESDRETYRRFEQDRDGVDDDEEQLYQATESMLRAAAGGIQGYAEDTQNEDIEEVENEDDEEDSEEYKEEETELEKYLRDVNGQARAKTAPLKAQKQGEHFKMTPGFSQLEQAAVCAVQLVQRSDLKFDLDSYEGQNSCKKFLCHIEKLCESIDVKCSKRQYRQKFSNAYKVLYKEGKLCYLTEILDSAQEAFPYLWVNGEKYVFSKEVIDAGRNLFNNFCKILYQIKDAYQRVCEEQSYEALIEIINEMRENLEEFDQNWVTYEQLYVIELMLIESDARRFITEAIEIDKEITSAEVRERAKGKIMVDCTDYNKNRGKLIEIINKINAVANPEGKGRDDLQAEILFQAEGLCRRVSLTQSKAVRKLAEAIRKSFQNIRTLLRKYEENIEGVDPQLKNNADLVQHLLEFEQSWEKGKNYFVNTKKCAQLLHFTSMIEGTAEKYKSFQEQIEDRDTVIFVTIPALLILKNLDDDDKGICQMFFPPMFEQDKIETKKEESKDESSTLSKYSQLKSDYVKLRAKSKNQYDFYNIVEKAVLEMEGEESSRINEQQLRENGMARDDLQKIVQQIRLLSMQLQRHKPADWNNFLDVALDN